MWECTVILTKNCLMLENYHVTQEFGPFPNYGISGEPHKLRKRVFSISQKKFNEIIVKYWNFYSDKKYKYL